MYRRIPITTYGITLGPDDDAFPMASYERFTPPELPFHLREKKTQDMFRPICEWIDTLVRTMPDVSTHRFKEKDAIHYDAVQRIIGSGPTQIATAVVEEQFNALDLMAGVAQVDLHFAPVLMVAAAFGEAWGNEVYPTSKDLTQLPLLTAAGRGPARFHQAIPLPIIPVVIHGKLCVINVLTHATYEIL